MVLKTVLIFSEIDFKDTNKDTKAQHGHKELPMQEVCRAPSLVILVIIKTHFFFSQMRKEEQRKVIRAINLKLEKIQRKLDKVI